MKRVGILVAAAALCLMLGACQRSAGIYNVPQRPIPEAMRDWQLTRIERVIAFAASDRGWKTEAIRPGLLRATLNVRTHTAVVDIPYSQSGYSIGLQSSQNLRQTATTIHHNYNNWIHNLERAIERRLTQAAANEELRPEGKKEE